MVHFLAAVPHPPVSLAAARLACAFLLLAGAAAAQGGPPPSRRAAGEALVRERCAPCHAVGRTGASPRATAPPLRVIARKYRPSDLEEAFAEGIMVGHQGADMPAFEFEPAQIDALVAYLRALRR